MVDIFKALSEESRHRIIALLTVREMCVCEIETCLNLTQSNASRHLTVLKKSGILENYKIAQWTYYKIDERFKKENMDLWRYLETKIKEMPTYSIDCNECIKCSELNLCNQSKSDS